MEKSSACGEVKYGICNAAERKDRHHGQSCSCQVVSSFGRVVLPESNPANYAQGQDKHAVEDRVPWYLRSIRGIMAGIQDSQYS
jgi:hypothetical protein